MTFVQFLVAVESDFWVLLLFLYILHRVVLALYLKMYEYDKWWLSLLPFGHLYCKKDLGAIPVWLLVITVVFSLFGYLTFQLVFVVPWLLLRIIYEFLFAKIFVDSCNPHLWAFIPQLKNIIMIKELIQCRN